MASTMASCFLNFSVMTHKPTNYPSSSSHFHRPNYLFISSQSSLSSRTLTLRTRDSSSSQFAVVSPKSSTLLVSACVMEEDSLKVMICGAPASGKGTQCELITKKYGLVHIAAGDLLRAEISAGSENGKRAKQFMEKGQLVPDDIVVMMVKDRLSQSDSLEKGWLLDGYPRSSSQATALKGFGFKPDIFIFLEVSEELLVERVVGRRLDPVTGKIYHLTYSPPETEEIASRLTQRFDDTEEKVKLRLHTHHQNVEAVLSMYEDVTVKVNGNASKEDVFARIDGALTKLAEQKKDASGRVAGEFFVPHSVHVSR